MQTFTQEFILLVEFVLKCLTVGVCAFDIDLESIQEERTTDGFRKLVIRSDLQGLCFEVGFDTQVNMRYLALC